MKKIFTFAFVAMMALFTTTVSACCIHCDFDDDDDRFISDSYTGVSEQRDVAPFNRVKVSNALNVNIVQGEEQSVVVKADDSVIDKVRTDVNDGVLRIYIDDEWYNRMFRNKNRKVIVDIVVPELTALEASGASSVKVSELRNENFTVKASGASDIILSDIIVKETTSFEVSGASHVKADGKGEKVIIRASGASDVASRSFATNIADIHASGASDVDVTAYDEIRVECNGASDVDYYGHPKVVDVNTSGASDVNSH